MEVWKVESNGGSYGGSLGGWMGGIEWRKLNTDATT